jgi:hypothetical protein
MPVVRAGLGSIAKRGDGVPEAEKGTAADGRGERKEQVNKQEDKCDTWERHSEALGWDLTGAVVHNPECGLCLQDLDGARIDLELTGENDGADWHWIVELRDGWAYIAAGCDYTGWDCTGWDCHSYAEVFRAASRNEALALCPEAVRVEFQDMIAAKETRRRNTLTGWGASDETTGEYE